MNAGESTTAWALSCELLDWAEARNEIFLLIHSVGKWKEHAEKGCWILADKCFAGRGTEEAWGGSQTPGLRISWVTGLTWAWTEQSSQRKVRACLRKKTWAEVSVFLLLASLWVKISGRTVSCVPCFKARVQELHISWFSNTKDYLGW